MIPSITHFSKIWKEIKSPNWTYQHNPLANQIGEIVEYKGDRPNYIFVFDVADAVDKAWDSKEVVDDPWTIVGERGLF